MERLYIKRTKTTPLVDFDPYTGELEISGESYPENSSSFYSPIIEWLNNHLRRLPTFTFTFKMLYFNTSSSKSIFDILDLLSNHYEEFTTGKVKWYYEEDDDDIMESGVEFLEGLSIPFQLIMIKE